MTKTVNIDLSTTIIDGLDENSAYSVHISASTGAVSGTLSMPVHATLLSKICLMQSLKVNPSINRPSTCSGIQYH